MRLFPYVLIRVSGGPFKRFEGLNLTKSCQISNEIHSCKQKSDRLKNKISDALYQIIALQKDAKAQNILLNFKRDIFNQRNIPANKLETIIPFLPREIKEDVNTYFDLREQIDRLRRKGEIVFAREVEESRKNFRGLAADENLQKGLLLSSQSLLRSTKSYLAKDTASFKKQDRNTEQSLLKYLSRMYAKTSPFSTFTNLAIAEIAQAPENQNCSGFLSIEHSKKSKVLSHIRLNNYLFSYLKGLLTKIPAIYHCLLLRPNPTLRKEDGNYVFLTNSNNIEAFQRMPANPALEVFIFLTKQKQGGILFSELVQTIIDNEYIDAAAEDIEAYINQLIDYGFLEYNIEVSGIDPDWDLKLQAKLKPIAARVPLVNDLLATLQEVRKLANDYGKSSLEGRKKILKEAYHQFRSMCMKLHEAAGLPEEERKPRDEYLKEQEEKQKAEKEKIADSQNEDEKDARNTEGEEFKHQSNTFFHYKAEQMFYEDTSLAISLQPDQKDLEKFVTTMNNLLQEVRHFQGHLDERDKMRHFFIEKYGINAFVDLLTFYEDYYREFKKPEAEHLKKLREAAQKKAKASKTLEAHEHNAKMKDGQNDRVEFAMLTSIKERQESNKSWLEQFIANISSQSKENRQIIELPHECFVLTNKKFPQHRCLQKANCSYGAFVQFYLEKQGNGREKLMGVLSGYLPGFGKMFSRFLHLFNDSVTNEMRSWNLSLKNKDDLFVENCDASYFNANLHPPLMPYEIRMPNGHNSLPAEKQIPVTDLQIRLNENENALHLYHSPSKKQVYVFDLGFQGLKGRSRLYRLVENFTMAEILSYYPLFQMINDYFQKSGKNKNDHIIVHPRIVYENRIILQRTAWHIPKRLLPFKRSDENDWRYFERLNHWRRTQGMPDEVFVIVNPHGQTENIEKEALKKLGRDDYKPQYISFKNPLLVNLFARLLKKVPKTLKIEEMLPNSQQLLKIGKSRYATEFVIQWYNK